ncbi:MAG: radical SAM protein [Candidatus Omnitrophica bacterium]|nr:radical SAM protein [Candidatus Omnitrophota bacterium]
MLRQIALQDSVVYGPVQSRRLGSSLGINPLPLGYKLCSSNCVYCQYGWTRPVQQPQPIRRAAELLGEIEQAFEAIRERGTGVDCITLAGNGEPTLHPDLDELIGALQALRSRYFPSAKLGILSDATQVHRPAIRRALQRLDMRYMKFDAGDEATWRTINDPLGQADWPRMIDGLKQLPAIVLQSMFVQGSYDNTADEQIDAWTRLVGDIEPLGVQVYTVDRAPADVGIVKVSRDRLEAIAAQLAVKTGVPAEVYD